MNTLFLNEYRCQCGKLLLKGLFFDGALEVKCKRCSHIKKLGNITLIKDTDRYLLIINKDGLIINVSCSAGRVLGYGRDELIDKHFTLISPSLPAEIINKVFGPEAILDTDNYFQLDTFHQTKDGKKIPVNVLAKLYQTDNDEKYLLTLIKLKKTNEPSVDDESDYSKKVCDFYFDLDKQGRKEYLSPSVEKIFGFCPERVVGRSYFDCLPEESRAESKKTFEHFASNELPYRIIHETEIGINNNKIKSDLYFTPKFNDHGTFVGYRVLGWVIDKS
jgi:PAS domain S-box-containing protein